MKVKKYKDKTFSRAVFKAKSELGDDIMILDSEEVDSEGILSGDQKFIEVTVTTDQTKPEKSTNQEVEPSRLFISNKKSDQKKSAESSSGSGQKETQVKKRETPESLISAGLSQATEVQKEPETIQEHKNDQDVLERALSMEQQLKNISQNVRRMISLSLPEIYSKYYEKLIKIGVEKSDADQIIRKAYERCARKKDVDRKKLLNVLFRRLKLIFDQYTENQAEHLQGNEDIFLVGSPGGGKTLSAMKLAGNQNIFPQRKVALASLDNFKLGGKYPLDKFSSISSLPFYSRGWEEISKKGKNNITIIDTAGRSVNDKKHISELKKLEKKSNNYNLQLVLDGTDDLQDMERIFEYFSGLDIDGIILTKMDQVKQIGKLVSILKQYKIPLTFVSDGQEIPEDIRIANKNDLAKKIKNLL